MGEFLFQHGYSQTEEIAMQTPVAKKFLKTAYILAGLAILTVVLIRAAAESLPSLGEWIEIVPRLLSL